MEEISIIFPMLFLWKLRCGLYFVLSDVSSSSEEDVEPQSFCLSVDCGHILCQVHPFVYESAMYNFYTHFLKHQLHNNYYYYVRW